MTASTEIRTGKIEFDELVPLVRSFLKQDAMDVVIDGRTIRGYRSPDARSIWIRDYSDIMRGIKYFEPDVKSVVEHFAETQAANGRIFDYFTTFPEKLPCERENWTKYVRVPVEADVEYRFIKAAHLAWQATGDDTWIQFLLPSMEQALNYTLTHPWRWDERTNLVKRAYTIDTWDFAYTAGKHDWLQFQIDDHTFWGIMHGDNSGYYEAFRIMSDLYLRFNEMEKARAWSERAKAIHQAMNAACWNGAFFTHFVKLTPMSIPGVDEAAQLSLSNPMDINRGVTSHEQAVSIISEYLRRRQHTEAFAEWFSIDPPFPDGVFGDARLQRGTYCNGGIMPLVGGELARAAFGHGFEAYGIDILERYYQLIKEKGETYLWYQPDGTPASLDTSTSPEATPTDGWGSSAMLYALVEGLAGVEDLLKCFEDVALSPRWIAAGIEHTEVSVSYAASGAYFSYEFDHSPQGISLAVETPESEIHFHVLLPERCRVRSVTRGGRHIPHQIQKVEQSLYVDFTANVTKESSFVISFL